MIDTPPTAEPFRRVVADPPWNERGGGRIKRGADRHYPLLKTPEIVRVMLSCPHWRNVSADAHLWLWVTNNFLPDGLFVMGRLGFRYVTNLVWVKPGGGGLGQYMRGRHELCLLGVRGKAQLPPTKGRPTTVVEAPRGRHSAKPAAAFKVFDKVSPGPCLELFARDEREGYTVWGNEVADVEALVGQRSLL